MTRPEIVRALESKGWKVAESWDSTLAMQSPGEFRLDIGADHSWTIGRFTDSDVDGVAVGRYRTIDEGEDLSEVLEAVKCAEMGIDREYGADDALAAHEATQIPRDVDERDVDGPVEIDDGGVEDLERLADGGEHETDLAYEYADQKLTGMREDGDD